MSPTITRDGWVETPEGQKAVGQRPDGEALVCLQPGCRAEFPDLSTFEAHSCATYRDGPELNKQEAPEAWKELEITSAAAEFAIEEGVDPTDVEGSGEDGRILVDDIEDAAEQE